MNFEFLNTCEVETEELQKLHEAIYIDLVRAERKYSNNPQECGVILRGAAEKICRLYNGALGVGCPVNYSLEEFLCYTQDDKHNALVSRFLSGVRKEQRDYLNKIRILGDDCLWGDETQVHGMSFEDRMEQNARQMMRTMMLLQKDLCKRVYKKENVSDFVFREEKLPQMQ